MALSLMAFRRRLRRGNFILKKEQILKQFNSYSSVGFVIRISFDIVISNIGMLVGMIMTLILWIYRAPITPGYFLVELFQEFWIANIPVLSLSCIFGYIVSGLYRFNSTSDYKKILLIISQAILVALLIHTLLLYFTGLKMPRTMFISGWFCILVLLFSIRFIRSYFYKTYKVVSLKTYDSQLNNIINSLVMIAHQDGWMPPEGLPAKAAWPNFSDDEILSVAAVLKSGKVNQWTGSEVQNFQDEFAAFCGVKHAIALANGTVALELALYALDIGPGDEVIVTPRTFVASASCVALRGAKPVFADVDSESQNIDAESIRKVITPRTRAIIPVHLAGWPCDMDPILEVAHEYGLKVIEDCAQCHGAVYHSRRPGRNAEMGHGAPIERDGVRLYPRITGSLGDMAAFSFCQDKIMTTGGEGGMLLTDDSALWEKAWAFKDHGKSYEAVYRQEHPQGFRWLHESLGTNWRLTEMQAAIGRRQLKKLPDWVAARRRNAAILEEAFLGIPGLRVTSPQQNIRHAYYKYYVFIRPERLKEGWDRDRIVNAVITEGAPCFSGSCSEVYLEKAFNGNGLRPVQRLPVARELGETSLMFLVHPTLTEKDMETMVDIVKKVMMDASL
jgi:dTDP-4-amino-4,6-dideoxygalactose transaminase